MVFFISLSLSPSCGFYGFCGEQNVYQWLHNHFRWERKHRVRKTCSSSGNTAASSGRIAASEGCFATKCIHTVMVYLFSTSVWCKAAFLFLWQTKPGVISSVSGLNLGKGPLQLQVVGKSLPQLIPSAPAQIQQQVRVYVRMQQNLLTEFLTRFIFL